MEVKSIPQERNSSNRCNQTGNSPTRIKIIASQWFVVLAVNCLAFNFGLFNTFFQMVAIQSQDFDMLSSLTLNLFMPCLGIVVFTCMAHFFGSRLTLLIGSVLIAISWLLFYFARQFSTVLAGFYIYHTTKVVVFTTGITYIAEVTEPKLRSISIVTTIMLPYLGTYVFNSTKNLSQHIIILYLIFPVLGLIGFFIAPESPHWLASKYKFEKAEASLAWIRGWTTPANVKSEFSSLKQNQEMPFSVSAFKKASLVICPMYIIYMLTGTAFTTFFFFFLVDMNHLSKLEFDNLEIAINVIYVVGPISFMPLVYFFGKRKLASVSLIVSALSLLIIVVSAFLSKGQKDIPSKLYGWTPTIFVFIIHCVHEMAISPIVYILNTELFPSSYRHFGVGIGRLLVLILRITFNAEFMDIVNAISSKTICIIFTIVCSLAFGMFYYTIPETEGRTLTDIEKHYKGVQKLNDRTRQNNDVEQDNSCTI